MSQQSRLTIFGAVASAAALFICYDDFGKRGMKEELLNTVINMIQISKDKNRFTD